VFCYLSDSCCNCSRLVCVCVCVCVCVLVIYQRSEGNERMSGERVTGLSVGHIDYHIARERGIIKGKDRDIVW
jgi:hypothetical protein